MARTKAALGSGVRLSDHLSASSLTQDSLATLCCRPQRHTAIVSGQATHLRH